MKEINIIESWDRDVKKNKPRYIPHGLGNYDFVAFRQIWTGTEFATWFIEVKDLRFKWLLKLFSKLNGFKE